mmetsp:Transcript_39487/g.126585  ORF Transcript_39487/g.126585 Transcript_39487/m.126585 type:complete len:83 (+) Transcript_39487:404-652(+)
MRGAERVRASTARRWRGLSEGEEETFDEIQEELKEAQDVQRAREQQSLQNERESALILEEVHVAEVKRRVCAQQSVIKQWRS